jgi:phage major head subunit gpT-like protein
METLYKRHKLARRRIQYDPSGRVGKAVQAFAEEDVFIFNERVWSKIVANTLTGPDGVALFSTAHPHAPGGGTQSNLTTNALSFSSFRAGMQAMQGFQRENGSYVRSRATHLFVPPSLEATAKEVAGADKPVNVTSGGALDGGANVVGVTAIANVYDGEVMVVVEPHMEDDPDMWILADLSKTGKPYTFAPGEEVVPSVTDTTDSDQVRLKDEFDFILQGDLITGPGHWQLCYAGKPS